MALIVVLAFVPKYQRKRQQSQKNYGKSKINTFFCWFKFGLRSKNRIDQIFHHYSKTSFTFGQRVVVGDGAAVGAALEGPQQAQVAEQQRNGQRILQRHFDADQL